MSHSKSKFKPATYSVYLGPIEEAQKRHEAYEKAAIKANSPSKNQWARDILDREAGYREK